MTYTRIHHLVFGILAAAVTTAVMLALSATTVPSSARTFNFTPAGSMVQQPLPPHWACSLSRALSDRTFACGDFRVR
jgi:hypothetical protein